MADIKSSGERSPNMVAIHGKNTKSEVYIYAEYFLHKAIDIERIMRRYRDIQIFIC